MKKLYMPSIDELYQIQEMGANTYKYLLAKVIERLTIEGVIYPNKGILKTAYKYLREDPYISHAICMMYPNEIRYSEFAQNDIGLCSKIIGEKQENITNLDYLSEFDPNILTNGPLLERVITLLRKELESNPKYRFEYKYNELLKRIINREVKEEELIFFKDSIKDLLAIEPAYALTLPDWFFGPSGKEKAPMLCGAINEYVGNYNIPRYVGEEYLGMDILTKPNKNVKRLIRCIEK